VDRVDRSTPTVRNASRIARRWAAAAPTSTTFLTDACPYAILAKDRHKTPPQFCDAPQFASRYGCKASRALMTLFGDADATRMRSRVIWLWGPRPRGASVPPLVRFLGPLLGPSRWSRFGSLTRESVL
jgi:hypothetical protein